VWTRNRDVSARVGPLQMFAFVKLFQDGVPPSPPRRGPLLVRKTLMNVFSSTISRLSALRRPGPSLRTLVTRGKTTHFDRFLAGIIGAMMTSRAASSARGRVLTPGRQRFAGRFGGACFPPVQRGGDPMLKPEQSNDRTLPGLIGFSLVEEEFVNVGHHLATTRSKPWGKARGGTIQNTFNDKRGQKRRYQGRWMTLPSKFRVGDPCAN